MCFKYVASALVLAVIISCVPNTDAKLVCYDDSSPANNRNKYPSISKYPFLVSVRLDGVAKCTGTIIAPTWILTAASCIGPNVSSKRVTVQYGVQNISRDGGKMASIRRRARPYWRPSEPHLNDILLLQLEGLLHYEVNVAPVRLAGSENDLAGKLAVLAGWTRNSADSTVANMQPTNLTVESNRDCIKQSEFPEDYLGIICTKYEGTEAVYPLLPSGGPLMYDGLQVGVASYQPVPSALPNVYNSISHNIKWIARIMEKYDTEY